MSRRIIAQRILTGEFLSWDVPLLDATGTREISGPGGINGSLAPATRDLLGADGKPILREWDTALYYEVDGTIRAGGIITRIGEDEEGVLRVEAPGFSRYPHGIPFLGDYQPGLGADPLDALREIWSHVQSFPNSDLGVTVDPLTSSTILDEVRLDENGVEESRDPYRLAYWDNRDCGQEIDAMLEAAPADYLETHTWNVDHSTITHHLTLGSPTIGTRRTDLRFAEGENVVTPVPITVEGDEFAQTVVALGKGEGREMARHVIEGSDERLRRVAVVTDKQAGQTQIEQVAAREHARLSTTEGFEQIVVREHLNASLSDIQPGDEIFVEADLEWFGRTRLWSRVVRITEPLSGGETAVLDLIPTTQEA